MAIGCHAVNRLGQNLTAQPGREYGRRFVLQWQEPEAPAPIEPPHAPHLNPAQRTVAVVKPGVTGGAHEVRTHGNAVQPGGNCRPADEAAI
jgi:hypothetical protein